MTPGQLHLNSFRLAHEIPAIPELLRLLELKGCIVAIDAAGTQTAIAEQIVAAGGDYVLALKGNHKGLAEDVQRLIEWGVVLTSTNCSTTMCIPSPKATVEFAMVTPTRILPCCAPWHSICSARKKRPKSASKPSA